MNVNIAELERRALDEPGGERAWQPQPRRAWLWQLMIEPATHRVEPRLIESNVITADVVVATTADVVVVDHD